MSNFDSSLLKVSQETGKPQEKHALILPETSTGLVASFSFVKALVSDMSFPQVAPHPSSAPPQSGLRLAARQRSSCIRA